MPPVKDAPEKPELSARLYALIHHIHGSCNRDLIEEVHRGELTIAQLRILERLRRSRRAPTIAGLAHSMGVHSSATTRLVDELDRLGLVDRYEDENDHRRRRVEITERGRTALLDLAQARLDALHSFTRTLTPEEHDKLEDALDELHRREEIAALTPTE